MSTDIYLTCGLVRCTQEIQAIRDIAFPTSVHRFPETYRHAHMGLVAPVQRLIDDLIKEAIQTLTLSLSHWPLVKPYCWLRGIHFMPAPKFRKRKLGAP